LFTKNSSRQAKQLIPHTTVLLYDDHVKMSEDFTQTVATKELAVAPQQYTIFHQGIYQKQHDSSPPLTLLT
jgi:hypothetical protein